MFSTFWGVAAWKYICSQLFRERLSEKVHATILKGIVGVSEFTFLLKEFHERDLCLRVGSTATVSATAYVLIISHITFRDCRKHIFAENLSRNSCISWNRAEK